MPGSMSQNLYYVLRDKLSSGSFVPETENFHFRCWLPRGTILFAPKDIPLMEYGEPEPVPMPTTFLFGFMWATKGKWQLEKEDREPEQESITNRAWGPYSFQTMMQGLWIADGKMESCKKKTLTLTEVTMGAPVDSNDDDAGIQEALLLNDNLMNLICTEDPPLLTMVGGVLIPAPLISPTEFGWINRSDR